MNLSTVAGGDDGDDQSSRLNFVRSGGGADPVVPSSGPVVPSVGLVQSAGAVVPSVDQWYRQWKGWYRWRWWWWNSASGGTVLVAVFDRRGRAPTPDKASGGASGTVLVMVVLEEVKQLVQTSSIGQKVTLVWWKSYPM